MIKNIQSKSVYIASIACVIHCLVTPFLVVIAPFIGSFFQNPIIELTLLLASIVCGSLIIYQGYCTHKKTHSFLLYLMGAILWVVHTLFEYNDIAGAKIYFTIGTLLVLGSYYISHRMLKCCPSKCCNG
tara:strand:- start:131 stop:517 length:387 start_codon:yes stop_codon:yes gene_type:complete